MDATRHGRVDVAERVDLHVDRGAGESVPHRPAEGLQAGLGRAVGDVAAPRCGGGDAREEHERPTALGLELPHERTTQLQGCEEVDGDQVLGSLPVADAVVVVVDRPRSEDGDVDPPQDGGGLVEEGSELGVRAGEVEGEHGHLDAVAITKLAGEVLQRLVAPGRHDESGAATGELGGDGPSDPGTGPHHECPHRRLAPPFAG